MNLTNQITFDPTYLSEKVKKDYSDHMTALVREFLQNSVDAGASEVLFDFNQDERYLEVIDDGCGMDADIMQNALFRVGGSHKETNGSVGGFGAAKLILLFQHERFEIVSTRNGAVYSVNGSGSSYSDIEESSSNGANGTRIRVYFSETYGHETNYSGELRDEYDNFEYKAKDFLRSCHVAPTIKWNHEVIPPAVAGPVVRELEWCLIRAEKTEYDNGVEVRIRGLKMFNIWVSGLKHRIFIELTSANSLDILTTNRDGLRYHYGQELDAIIGELSADKNSFANKKGDMVPYKGQSKSARCVLVSLAEEHDLKLDMEVIDELSDDPHEEEPINPEVFKKVVDSLKMQCAIQGKVMPDVEEKVQEALQSATEYDFIVEYEKNAGKIPAKLDPAKGIIPKYRTMLQIYIHTIKHVYERLERSVSFRTGWVISDDAEAKYIKKENGQIFFLLNPEGKDITTAKDAVQRARRIARTAVHEVVHELGYQYHDENYLDRFTSLLECLDDITNWRKFIEESKCEQL
jgi:HSP90 family molecular chaperone